MRALRDISLRTVGASAVLLALVVVALIQVLPSDEAEVTSPRAEGPTAVAETTEFTSTTVEPEPFVYRVGLLAGISTDNFWNFYGSDPSVWNSYVLGPTKPALLTVDPGDGSLRPELATSIPTPRQDGNGWYVAISLDERMEWSDGTPITAADVVFTFEAVRNLDLGGSWAAAFPPGIEGMTATDSHTLRIDFEKRPTLGTWPHAVGLAPVMAEHIWGEVVASAGGAEDLYRMSGADDVGGGPLAFSGWEGDEIVSFANPGYPNPIGPEKVEYRVYTDEKAAVEGLIRGEVDTVLTPKGLSPEYIGEVTAHHRVAMEVSPANGVRYLGFNLDREPMTAPAFRRALALLLDREALAAQVPGGATAAYSFINPQNRRWYDAEAARSIVSAYQGPFSDRLETALEGLRQAGYSWETEPSLDATGPVAGSGLLINGQAPAPLTILTPGDAYDPARPIYAEAIAEALRLLGFEARPVETDFDTVVELAFTENEEGERTYDMYLLGWTLGNPSLPGHYRPLFAQDGVMNNTGYRSDTFDQHLVAYEGSYTVDEALRAVWLMEATLSQDLPYLFLYTNQVTELYRADRVTYRAGATLGGLQGRLGGIEDVAPVASEGD